MTVDTLSLARELRAAEIPSEQAEAIAAAIGRADVETAATKADLVQLGTELRGDMALLEANIRTDVAKLDAKVDTKIEALRSTLLLWFVGTIITLGTLILAALKL